MHHPDALSAGELGEAGEHMHKLAEADMQKYRDDGHQDEDELNLKKLQVSFPPFKQLHLHVSLC